ncbi:UNVERIFIED_CONTAM: hypothetical protein NCL1_59289 [Trichonephila clavipes]
MNRENVVIRYTIKNTHKIHLGQIILQSVQYAYPYIIKLFHMGKKATEKYYIYNFPKRNRDGMKHTRSKIVNECLM